MKRETWIFVGFLLITGMTIVATSVGIASLYQKDAYLFTTLSGASVLIYGGGVYQHHTVSQVYQVIPHDIVTLVFAVPLFIGSYISMRKNSGLGTLIFTGVTLYLFFSYAIYTFYAIFNQLFLAYVGIMGLSFYLFLSLIKAFDYEALLSNVNEKYRRKTNVFYLIGIPVLMGLVWLGDVIPTLFSGVVPQSVLSHSWTLVPHAIDLAFLLPFVIVGGIHLYKGKALGYYLSYVIPVFLILMMGAVLSKGVMLTITNTEFAYPMIIFIGSFFLLSIALFVLNIKALNNAKF